jgi:hypothetical protein
MAEKREIDSKNALAEFEAGKKRFEALVAKRHRFQAELEASRRQFLEASREAELEFQTSKLPELRELYRTREAAKLQDILEFVMGVDEACADLEAVEKQAA